MLQCCGLKNLDVGKYLVGSFPLESASADYDIDALIVEAFVDYPAAHRRQEPAPLRPAPKEYRHAVNILGPQFETLITRNILGLKAKPSTFLIVLGLFLLRNAAATLIDEGGGLN